MPLSSEVHATCWGYHWHSIWIPSRAKVNRFNREFCGKKQGCNAAHKAIQALARTSTLRQHIMDNQGINNVEMPRVGIFPAW
eukprot:4470507-Amphidinium_carterae.1